MVVGPCLSQSGYGYQTRFALKALRSREDLFDIYIQPIPWGQTGWLWEDNEFRRWMDERITATQVAIHQKQLSIEMSLQVTIPNEWKKMAPINIGYTAGIETTKVSPNWLQKGNEEVDKIIVVSTHSKMVYEETKATATNQQTGQEVSYKLEKAVEVVNYCVEHHDASPIDNLNLDLDFNFLAMSQWSPRKNFENTIKWWVEEFIDQEVGLVIKTNVRANNLIDRHHTEDKIKELLLKYPDRKCKIYLLHGDLTSNQIHGLYQHPKIKAFINIAHGEGFGLPLFEAAQHGLPIVTIGWSGQLDYLCHNGVNLFQEVDYTLQPIQKEAVWPGVIEGDSMWAFADQGSYKMSLRKVYKKWPDAKNRADELKSLIHQKFNSKEIYQQFCNHFYDEKEAKKLEEEIEALLQDLV